MKIFIEVKKQKTKKIKFKPEDLFDRSIGEILEEKGVTGVHPDDIKVDYKSGVIEVLDGDSKILTIEDTELLDKTIKQIVKEKTKAKTLRGTEIRILKCGDASGK